MPILEVKELRTEFRIEEGVVHAVDGVSFSVENGETLGIVGESGCGKSVTAMSIMRLIPDPPGHIASGQILWKGKDILSLPDEALPDFRGAEIAMIFQDPMTSLNPVFTVERQLGEVLEKRFKLVGEPARKKMVEALEMVGIADPADRLRSYPHELSGGMKQRIMIAMALMCEPDLLIADEPTTALDVTVQAQILHLMKSLQERVGAAIILITHDMAVVAETCDRVAVMYAGRVVEFCDVYKLFESNRHPYTFGLLRSIPKEGLTKDDLLPTIEGIVPSLIHPPQGCRFADRCFKAQDRCKTDDPKLRDVGEGHLVACHFPIEEGDR
ncbi:MAG: ABC transporter ATP-binding protein [Candidatus Eisenbacteria bacterium]|uniref:ABC transporter ATP-binding protein n=1 Tax=Eiseniibacteriota bacterium TaxID=2212470 RepID=A0A956N9X7_UNCEI|nr:ABC transporter ATP-binding protein [Candidatus Eisenbacteria bacterium]MCB9465585.1 ABC transporter ATP-binding protein [Candidatus Eisenbacteria bacterium]